MAILGLTNAVATWLRAKTGAIERLSTFIETSLTDGNGLLSGQEISLGPLRFSRSVDGENFYLWNTDYLSGTGEESWGFVDIGTTSGIFGQGGLAQLVLERCIHIIDQRLQGLKIDGALIPRVWDGNIHTCLAGRGSEARKYSVAYFERHVGGQVSALPSLICVGPHDEFNPLVRQAAFAAELLSEYVKNANLATSSTRKIKPPGDIGIAAFAEVFGPFFDLERSRKTYEDVEISVSEDQKSPSSRQIAATLTYAEWAAPNSQLSSAQRRILESDAILKHPLRIVGPAGSGKSLLMQLLAIRRIKEAAKAGSNVRILYVAHNSEMVKSIRQRFEILFSDELMTLSDSVVFEVKTLSELSRNRLEVGDESVIDTDADEAKKYQLAVVERALDSALVRCSKVVEETPILSVIGSDEILKRVFAVMLVSEISLAIKGQGLQQNKRRYVESEKALSRLHGVLPSAAREFVFEVFESYHREVFEEYSLLDSDDLAISLLGKLRTPIWDLRRKSEGYDFIFVDETQLFNENERRVFPLLCKSVGYVPIVLALDEAQSIFGQSSAGLSALGIENISNESLPAIHRSTRPIVDLAFYIVQRCGDLFGADFPDFTKVAERLEPSDHPLAAVPLIERCGVEQVSFGKFIRKRVAELRKSNQRQIGVIVHASRYWDEIRSELLSSELPIVEVLTRGEKLSPTAPIVALTKPEFVGGQEFDSVILIGLEQGVVPPAVSSNDAFNVALEQQALREMYLSVTRARYRVVIALAKGASPTSIIQSAMSAGLVHEGARYGSVSAQN